MAYMEDDTKRFLNKIVTTIGLGLLWLFIHMTFGIYAGWFFFHERPTTGNYIYYTIAIASLIGLIIIFKKIWKERFPHG